MKTKVLLVLIVFLLIQNASLTQWQPSSNGIEGKNISTLYIHNNEIWAGTVYTGIYKSTNEGNSWLLIFSVFSDWPRKFEANQNYDFYIGHYTSFRSSNNGINWVDAGPGGSNNPRDLIKFNSELYLAVYNSGIYKSIIGGNWIPVNNGLNSLRVQGFGQKDNFIFVGTEANGIAKKSDADSNWEPVNNGLNNLNIKGFCSNGSGIFAYTNNSGNGNGVYYSSNYGQNWIYRGLANKDIRSIVSINNVIFTMVWNEGIYRSLNYGDTWILVNEGITNLRAKHLILYNNYLYYGAESNLGTDKPIWKRPVNEVIGISPISNNIPKHYSLYQNFPNPFNPTTQIKFDLPKSFYVKLSVYDILGKEVTSLINEELKAGEYSVDWNAENYPSGTYFYSIKAGNFTETRMMVLLK